MDHLPKVLMRWSSSPQLAAVVAVLIRKMWPVKKTWISAKGGTEYWNIMHSIVDQRGAIWMEEKRAWGMGSKVQIACQFQLQKMDSWVKRRVHCEFSSLQKTEIFRRHAAQGVTWLWCYGSWDFLITCIYRSPVIGWSFGVLKAWWHLIPQRTHCYC